MCRRCASLLFSALLLGLLTRSVPAQELPAPSPAPAPASSSDQPLPLGPGDDTGNLNLRETTARGILLFQQGDYDGAIQAFTAAYVISPKPMFLFNIAQAHRKVGRPREALLHYQLFLRKAPDTPLRPETEAYIELVRAQLAAAQPPQLPPPQQLPPQQQLPPPPLLSAQETPAAPPLYKRPWLWGTLGAVVAIGTGVAVGVYLGTRPPSTTLGIIEPTF